MQTFDQTSEELSPAMRKQLLALPAVRTRLEFLFALLAAAGGLILASGQETASIAMMAVFSAVVGFVFVDWLRLFELPPIGAYLAMGGSAAYCVRDFWGMQQRGEPEMVSVALLLVLVQGVLMLQRKSRRILEQIAVFCLLELVVAAIFNDAFDFGLWLLPIAIVGAGALSLLGLVTLMESIDVTLDHQPAAAPTSKFGRIIQFISGRPEHHRQDHSIVASSSPESVISIYLAAGPWSRYALLALTPAVFLVAAAFFYVLPRRINPARPQTSGPALVGFDDQVRMEQLGQVMQSPKIAIRIRLTDARTQKPYELDRALYLRGKVLEKYEVDYSSPRPVAQWVSTDLLSSDRLAAMPAEYRPTDLSELDAFDSVRVKITCEQLSRPALFSIAPYHAGGDALGVVHSIDRWTLSRDHSNPPFPRIEYEFGTHAFKAGVQTQLIAQDRHTELTTTLYEKQFKSELGGRQTGHASNSYTDLMQFDRSTVPSASIIARQLIDELPNTDRSTSAIAERFEQFFRSDPRFVYTLNLNASPIPNVDPVEQFLSVDRRGHCQYFASALALMLRSVGIPCRVVVGYRTEEYNALGDYYIARQLHAHSWVEALINADQLSGQSNVFGQRKASRYWMRLDPTPAASELDDGNRQGVEGLVNMANNIIQDYVVDMDGAKQNDQIVDATGLGKVQESYNGFFAAFEEKMAEIRAGRLGEGELSLRDRLPIIPILAIATLMCLVVFLLRLRIPKTINLSSLFGLSRLFGGHGKMVTENFTQRPELAFYAETLEQLERIEIRRGADETPTELRHRVGDRFPTLGILTDAFVQLRYGQNNRVNNKSLNLALAELKSSIDRRLADHHRGDQR
ncbi:MAG: DUF3488 domain-containing protein [Planctomycetales bacterium]|nr:DUF3488 domain-containing protein [Planctomycetales bacterium]